MAANSNRAIQYGLERYACDAVPSEEGSRPATAPLLRRSQPTKARSSKRRTEVQEPSRSLVGIDLFSGAGGMSLGAELAGIDVRVALEADHHASKTFQANHPGTTLISKRIEAVRSIEVDHRGQPLVIFGGPPCQGFSTSNQRTRSSANPVNWLFRHYMRLVRALMPEWVVFENVTGMVTTEGGWFTDEVLRGFARAGYTTSHFILNAVDFGIPQRRSRLFIVASLDGIRIQQPAAGHERVTVRDAIGDLPILQNAASTNELPYRCAPLSEYARRLRGDLLCSRNHLVSRNAEEIIRRYTHIPQGGNWSDIPARHMKTYADRTRCHTGIYHRLKYSEPSVVIGNFRKNMLIHPTQNRGLSVREAARLQSFPDNFEFHGSIGFQQQQVGNAVPPLLALAVFKAIQNAEA